MEKEDTREYLSNTVALGMFIAFLLFVGGLTTLNNSKLEEIGPLDGYLGLGLLIGSTILYGSAMIASELNRIRKSITVTK